MGRTLVDKRGFPGGAGLVSAGVFGRFAGRTAATESAARVT